MRLSIKLNTSHWFIHTLRLILIVRALSCFSLTPLFSRFLLTFLNLCSSVTLFGVYTIHVYRQQTARINYKSAINLWTRIYVHMNVPELVVKSAFIQWNKEQRKRERKATIFIRERTQFSVFARTFKYSLTLIRTQNYRFCFLVSIELCFSTILYRSLEMSFFLDKIVFSV